MTKRDLQEAVAKCAKKGHTSFSFLCTELERVILTYLNLYILSQPIALTHAHYSLNVEKTSSQSSSQTSVTSMFATSSFAFSYDGANYLSDVVVASTEWKVTMRVDEVWTACNSIVSARQAHLLGIDLKTWKSSLLSCPQHFSRQEKFCHNSSGLHAKAQKDVCNFSLSR